MPDLEAEVDRVCARDLRVDRSLGPLPLLALSIVLLFSGCGRSGETPTQGASPAEETRAPQRILTLAPSIAEIAFALGLGDRVVGVGDFVLFPPEAAAKPRLGGLINPNLEAMVRLQPDLAILLPSESDIGRPLERLGIETLIVPSETLVDLEAAVLAIGRRCGVEHQAEELQQDLRALLAPDSIGADRRVMIAVGRPAGPPAEILVAGPGTFLDELLTRLGAVNVFADASALYPQISLEQVLARSPDLILEVHAEEQSTEQIAARQRDWQEVLSSSGAADIAVEVISGDWTVIPGPRLPLLYRAMAQALRTVSVSSTPRNGAKPDAVMPALIHREEVFFNGDPPSSLRLETGESEIGTST